MASDELAREMTEAYIADTDSLELGRPDSEPLATEMIGPIVAQIEALIERATRTSRAATCISVFAPTPATGSLSHRRVEDMDQGEGGDGVERKQDPLDFALWKGRKQGEDTWWPSPWGDGRPGWHIECSAMAGELLGLGFDIHGGGSDLLFPHHENEAAQARAATGAELPRFWMHNGMIQMTGEKMASPSATSRCCTRWWRRYGRDATVMYLASGHYRQPQAFSESELEDARRRVERVREALGRLEPGASPPDMAAHREAFFDALAADFNTPAALAAMFEWIREANRRGSGVGDGDLRAMLGVLALDTLEPRGAGADVDPRAAQLLQQREQARKDRRFDVADELRDELRALGWEIRDGPDGPELIAAAS